MKRLLLVCLVLCAGLFAQNYTPVTATQVKNGNTLLTGRLCFQGTDDQGNPISFHIGGGGQAVSRPFCFTLTNGVVQMSSQVPNADLTSPAHIRYTIQAYANSGPPLLTYTLVNVSGGGAFNFDQYIPPGSLPVFGAGVSTNGVVNVQQGSLNFQNGTGVTVSNPSSNNERFDLNSSVVLTSQSNTFSAGLRQVFTASTTQASLNIPCISSDPSTQIFGDVWTRCDSGHIIWSDGNAPHTVVNADDVIPAVKIPSAPNTLGRFNSSGTDALAGSIFTNHSIGTFLLSVHAYLISCSGCNFTVNLTCADPEFASVGPSVTITSDLAPSQNSSGIFLCGAGNNDIIYRVTRNSGTGTWIAYWTATQI